MNKIIVFVILFLFILTGGVFGYKLYALNNMYTETVMLKQFSINEKLQPHIVLEFSVVNPSFVDNTIQQITYHASLVDYDQELFSGVLAGKAVASGDKVVFVVDKTLSWKPDIAVILDMLQREQIMVEFSTLTTVDYFGFDLTSEKKASFDIAASVKPALQKQVNKFNAMLSGMFGAKK